MTRYHLVRLPVTKIQHFEMLLSVFVCYWPILAEKNSDFYAIVITDVFYGLRWQQMRMKTYAHFLKNVLARNHIALKSSG